MRLLKMYRRRSHLHLYKTVPHSLPPNSREESACSTACSGCPHLHRWQEWEGVLPRHTEQEGKPRYPVSLWLRLERPTVTHTVPLAPLISHPSSRLRQHLLLEALGRQRRRHLLGNPFVLELARLAKIHRYLHLSGCLLICDHPPEWAIACQILSKTTSLNHSKNSGNPNGRGERISIFG